MKTHEYGLAASVWVALSCFLAATTAAQPVFLPLSPLHDSGFASGVEMGEDGSFVVDILTETELFWRRFDAHGLPSRPEIPVNAATLFTASSMTRDAAGRLVVVWSDPPWIWGRRFASNGSPLGAAFPVNTSTTPDLSFPHIANRKS